ncbi:MAG: APC family permease [Pirellulaceae bacterium]|nr:APC family permease [Pirellulaceae bacterium]
MPPSETDTANSPSPVSPEKSLGFASLIGLVVANMIGVGVFTSSGFSLSVLGNPGRVMLAWMLCGVWAISGAHAYGSLVSRLPISGGEYAFLSRLAHPSIGFLAGWISLIAGFTAPIALSAKAAAVHLLPETRSDQPQIAWVAAVCIMVAALCHAFGIRLGTRTQNGLVAVKLLLLLPFIIVGLWQFSAGNWLGGAPLPERSGNLLPPEVSQWWTLVGSMSWIALSYTGFNAAVYVAAESPRTSRQVPQAMLWGTLLVTLLYCVLNWIIVYAPGPQALVHADGSGRENVALIAAQVLGGDRLAELLRATILLAMLTSVFAMLMLGPRVYRQMAADGVMPKILDADNFRWAIALQAVLSIVAVFLGSILELMTYLGLTLSACGSMTVAALWWIRRRQPHSPPLGRIEQLSAAIYLAMSLCFLVAAAQQRTQQFIAMLATFAIGTGVYLGWTLLRKGL